MKIASCGSSSQKETRVLPDMNPNFARFIAPAMVKPQLWRLIAGLACAVVFYVVFLYAVLILASENGIQLIAALVGQGTPLETLLLLFTFVGMGGGVILAAHLFQGRGLMSLLGPDLRMLWRHFVIAATVIFAFSVAIQVAMLFVQTPVPNLPFSVWIVWVLPALALILVQTSAEELVFRGYLQQQLAARFSSRWVWWVLPSVLFGLAHYEPSSFGSNAWLVVADTTLFGLIAADITARTGNLGGAIGLHFVNNMLAFLFIAPKDDMNGLALNTSSFGVLDIEPMRMALMADFVLILIAYVIYLKVINKRDH